MSAKLTLDKERISTMDAINPATGETLRSFDTHTLAYCFAAAQKAHESFLQWRQESFAARAKPMRRAGELLLERKETLGRLITEEMGKPLKSAIAEIEKCASACSYYAEHAESFLAAQPVKTEAAKSYVSFEPLGVVLAIMPWNFPFWQVFRFAAPTLMAGNAALLKHASNTPGCAIAIEEVLRDAGFPDGLFTTLLLPSAEVEDMIAHPLVRAVTLTGSTQAGKAVAKAAGAQVKKTVLELGGSDPYIILADADLDLAARVCAESRMMNGGQSCIAAKRFIVLEAVAEAFTEKLSAAMEAYVMGDPMLPETTLGPMARTDLRDQLHSQVTRSISQGARCVLGGKIPAGKGAFYPPTILAGVAPGIAAFDEETFGPVAAIIPARSEEEALRLANATAFGLGAAVFTRDKQRGEALAGTALEAGSCFVNALVRSDPRLPFGGVKESGYGRELSSFGIHEFVNIKTVYVA